MKRICISIALLAIIMISFVASAAEQSSVILDLKEAPLPSEIKEMPLEERVQKFLELGKHFDKQYPGEAIYTDFTEDVATQMPGLTRQQVYDYKGYIRSGLSAYRYVREVIAKVKESYLAPEPPPLILDDSEYDLLSPIPEYVESNEAVIIPDFKKIISYTYDPKETKSYKAKLLHDAKDNMSKRDFEELNNIISRIELRKLPYYDIIYNSPLTGNQGIGDWQYVDRVRLRIITAETGVKNQKTIHGIIHFYIPDGKMIVAVDSKGFFKPKISFEGSKNLKNYDYDYPLPSRYLTKGNQDWQVYALEAAIPVTFEVENTNEPLEIVSEVEFMLCDAKLECSTEKLTPTITLNSEEPKESAVSTFVYQASFHNIPSENSEILQIKKVMAEKTKDHGEVLKILLESSKKISSFEIYVGNQDNISLDYPRVSIDGKKITVRILPTDSNTSLADKTFEISAMVNKVQPLRKIIKAEASDILGWEKTLLSFSIFMLAVLGGFLLNFMPCVLPVLSLKLLSLTKFGAKKDAAVRHNFYYTLLGIYSSFLVITLFLAGLKYLGHSIGWGMQFQNPIFLITMVFAIILFILDITGVINIQTPDFLNKLVAKSQKDSLLHFLTGAFVVLMATPCTAPYLGTAVGFALAGSMVDLLVIMGGVALGLSLPYIILYMFPILMVLIPSPGPWMKKVSNFMLFMLFLTLIWLFSILLAQTNTWFIARLLFYCILFFAYIWLFVTLKSETKEMPNIKEDISNEDDDSYKRVLQLILPLSILIVPLIAYIDGYIAHQKHYEEISITRRNTLDLNEINQYVKDQKTVLVVVGADWCLTCSYNNATVFNNPVFKSRIDNPKIVTINVDWTNYDEKVLQFMEKYGRSGLPFYIIFSPLIPDGMVLPEILTEQELGQVIENFTI